MADAGARVVIVGVGARTPTVTVFETPPYSTTLTLAAPGLAIKDAGTVAVNCVALTYLVARAERLNSTIDPDPGYPGYGTTWGPGKNPEPLTVSVKSGPPAAVSAGLTAEIAGGGAVIPNCNGYDES